MKLLGALFDFLIVIFLAWGTIHYGNILKTATESVDVTRAGFQMAVSMIALCAVVIVIRMDWLLKKDK